MRTFSENEKAAIVNEGRDNVAIPINVAAPAFTITAETRLVLSMLDEENTSQ